MQDGKTQDRRWWAVLILGSGALTGAGAANLVASRIDAPQAAPAAIHGSSLAPSPQVERWARSAGTEPGVKYDAL